MQITITEDQAGKRVDVFLVEKLPELSRASIQKLCDAGKITINGKSLRSSYKLKDNDKLKVDYDQVKDQKIPSIELSIIYEDDDCVVIDKPIGLLTHSKGAFNPEATVATWLSERTEDMDGERAGIVHRLDRATSGVMICAKNPKALAWLQKQFSQRKVKKTYLAIVTGKLKDAEAMIDMPIERNPKAPATFRVGANGKSATTKYEILKSNDKYSLLGLKPETGRTHQLRVHLKHLGHAIVGDTLYDGEPAERLFLHALSLEITLPSKERRIFLSNLPESFKKYFKEIKDA